MSDCGMPGCRIVSEFVNQCVTILHRRDVNPSKIEWLNSPAGFDPVAMRCQKDCNVVLNSCSLPGLVGSHERLEGEKSVTGWGVMYYDSKINRYQSKTQMRSEHEAKMAMVTGYCGQSSVCKEDYVFNNACVSVVGGLDNTSQTKGWTYAYFERPTKELSQTEGLAHCSNTRKLDQCAVVETACSFSKL